MLVYHIFTGLTFSNLRWRPSKNIAAMSQCIIIGQPAAIFKANFTLSLRLLSYIASLN